MQIFYAIFYFENKEIVILSQRVFLLINDIIIMGHNGLMGLNLEKLVCFVEEDDDIPDDFSGFIVLDGDDSEAEIDDAEEKLVSTTHTVITYIDYTLLYNSKY